MSREVVTPIPERVATLRTFKSEDGKQRYLAVYDAVLRQWPVQYEELTLSTRYGATHVIASGPREAPPLVLLSSMMASATVWRANIAGLSRHFRTFGVDLIGEPNKSEPIQRMFRRRDFAIWLTDLFDALQTTRVSIVGNSYGGFLALNQASLTPDRVDRVVLISPAATFASIWPFYLRALMSVLPGGGKGPAFFAWLTDGIPLSPLDATWGDLMNLAATEGRPVNIVPPRVFGKRELRRLRVPILLLIGDREVIYKPVGTLKRALDRVPGLEGAIIAGANHLGAMTQPDVVNERIIQFLQRNRQST